MPNLTWIGKEAVVKHHKDVPFRLIEPVAELSLLLNADRGSRNEEAARSDVGSYALTDVRASATDADKSVRAPNLIVEGDNLHALKALLPRYAGQVKCIYIDPPYNTGNEGWAYNDNVKSPEILKWLGEVVGREGETLDRHDRWLCMMYPRLLLLKQFLREDGSIFVSIDDNEVGNLRLLMDEIFGSSNFVAQFVWKARQYLDSRALSGVSTDHEYIYFYSKKPGGCRLKGKSRDEGKYTNPDKDERGPWMSRSILGLANAKDRPNLHYPLVDSETGLGYPCPTNTGWRYSQETMASKMSEGRILFPKKPTGRPREKVFLNELQTSGAGFPSVIDGIAVRLFLMFVCVCRPAAAKP
ncbi:MAG: site-specific DNA-methyltransferase [Pyrinomonadaceae bacterium]|nr:site-specific DNA-methyltransferase [Pyrinomonadaceae bacterium]